VSVGHTYPLAHHVATTFSGFWVHKYRQMPTANAKLV